MPRDVLTLIEDIELRCERIIQYTDNKNSEEFFQEMRNTDAALYNLIVIGEAVKNLPPVIRSNYADRIPFSSIAGARDIYAHEYFCLNYELIWGTLTEDVPKLLREIKRLKKQLKQ